MPHGDRVDLMVRTNAPANARINLLKGGVVAATAVGATLTHQTDAQPATYRVEVLLEGGNRASAAPWLLSNPIYVGARTAARAAAPPARPVRESVLYANGPLPEGGRVEINTRASGKTRTVGIVDVMTAAGNSRLQVRYALGGTTADNPYVSLILPAGRDLATFDRLAFKAQAKNPMRLWVYLLAPGPNGPRYWRKSVFLNEQIVSITIPFAELLAVSPDERQRTPPLADIESLVFAVDQIHTPLGAGGQFWVDDVRYQR